MSFSVVREFQYFSVFLSAKTRFQSLHYPMSVVAKLCIPPIATPNQISFGSEGPIVPADLGHGLRHGLAKSAGARSGSL